MKLGTFIPNKTVAEHSSRMTEKLARGEVAPAIRESLLAVVNHAANNAPRNLQKRIGPSEIGHPCARNVAHKLAGTTIQRKATVDPWPSIVGVATHDWLGQALERANRTIGAERWLSESRVYVAEGIFAGCGADAHLSGSCDCYDSWLKTVVDFKILGNTQHGQYLTGYVSEQYRTQIHTYGYGLARAGHPVEHVSLAIFGRAKRLQDLYVWSEPFDPSIAERALDRLAKIQTVVSAGYDPDLINATPTKNGCYFCPFRPCCPEGMAQK